MSREKAIPVTISLPRSWLYLIDKLASLNEETRTSFIKCCIFMFIKKEYERIKPMIGEPLFEKELNRLE
jgi:hypothetical protein